LIYPARGVSDVKVPDAIAALRRGEFVLVYDGDGREAETDLTIASEFVTPAAVRALRKEAGGFICMTLSGEVQRRIGLPFMTEVLRKAGSTYPVLEVVSVEDFKYDRHSAFSIAVNHRDTFTGVTDVDRAKTIARLAAIAKEAVKRENGWAAHVFAEEFRSPGHVPLLNAAEPLLEARRGHTELTTALMIMAGLAPTATICEMMADDGRALSKEDAKAYARARNLAFLEGQDIVRAWRSWSV
jgi:3,4-dihydroxy 2-butanone 4-phosphate synthase